MRVVKIFALVWLMALATAAAALAHGDSGIYSIQAMAPVSSKDRADREEVEKLHQQAGEFSQAGLHERAMAAAEKELEIARQSDYPGTVGAVGTNLCKLAASYVKQSLYSPAESLYRSTLKLYEDKAGPGDPAVAVVLNNLATVQERQGNLEQAEAFYKRALEINEKALGENHASVSVGLKNLAGLYRFIHRDDEADKLAKRALAIDAIIAAGQEQVRRALMGQ